MRQRPRRVFAAPFILTIAAAIPACSSGTPRTVDEPKPDPAAEPYQTWTVRDSGGEQCSAYVEVDCPPPEQGTTCNPPPPMAVACPAGLAEGGQVTVVQLEEGGPCYAEAAECPEGGCDREPTECPSWE